MFCAACGTALIERDWHAVRLYRLDGDRCVVCGATVPGRFHPGRHAGFERHTAGTRIAVGV